MTDYDFIMSTVCTGIGSPEQGTSELQTELNFKHKIGFYCEIDKYARTTYEANFDAGFMVPDMAKCEWDGDEYYSDLFVGGIPCQAFSLAGLRKVELDPRGLLIYDYIRYVRKHNPKVFIIENVKGLLSDSKGKTFQNWLHLLGQSVNGNTQMFNHPDSLPYNLHWTVLNSKDFEVPQNRERVFIVGIRNDIQNDFRFPKGVRLTKKLKDILEPVVDERFYLSDKMISGLIRHQENSIEKGRGFKFEPKSIDTDKPASAIRANAFKMGPDDNYIYVSKEVRTAEAKAERRQTGSNSFRGKELTFAPSEVMNCLQTGLTNDHLIVVGNLPIINDMRSRVNSADGISPTITSNTGGGHQPKIMERAAGYRENENTISAFRGDAKRSGMQEEVYHKPDGIANTLTIGHPPKIIVNEATKKGYAEAAEGDSINLSNPKSKTRRGRVGVANTLDTACNQAVVEPSYRIRRLTPLECFRLQGFPDSFFYKAKYEGKEKSREILAKFPNHKGKRVMSEGERIERMSDSQLYKQAGNSITTKVIKAIIKNLLPILVTNKQF